MADLLSGAGASTFDGVAQVIPGSMKFRMLVWSTHAIQCLKLYYYEKERKPAVRSISHASSPSRRLATFGLSASPKIGR
jgi:hypothetical protein